MGETNGGGKGITHGICKSCMDAELAKLDGDAGAAPVPSGAEPIYERYVPANELWETAPEWRPIECDERDEPDWIADADGYDWETEPVSAHTQAARV